MQTLGEGSIIKGLVLSALNKLPNIKADLVRTDEGWEEWEMESHCGDSCPMYDTLEKGRLFFSEHRLCFNCGGQGHRENKCRGRGCYKCKARHHTFLCKNEQKNKDRNNGKMLTGFLPSKEEKSLPAIIPIKIKGTTFWAYLVSGSGRNFLSRDAINKLKLKPKGHETRHILTANLLS